MFQSDLDQALLALYQRPQDFNLEFDSDNFDSFYVKRDDYFIEIMLHEIELFWKRCEWLEKNHGASEWDYNNCLPESIIDRKSTRLNSSHVAISYAVFCLKKKKQIIK